MPHLSGRCTCGRPMHWPRGTRYGDTWECYRCGMIWTYCRDGELPLTTTRSRPPAPAPTVVVLPVLRERIRELPPPLQANPFLEPGARQLPAPSRHQRTQPTMGCLPAFVAMVGVGAGGVWWLVSQFV